MMKKSLEFIKQNPTIIGSIFLIVAVSFVVFFNSYYSLEKFQTNTDALLQSKAALAEDVFQLMSEGYIGDEKVIQERIENLKNKDSEVKEITIFKPLNDENEMRFGVLASTNQDLVGKEIKDTLYLLAWNGESRGIAFLGNEEGERYWNIVKPVISGEKQKEALVSFQMSLAEHDSFTEEAVSRSWLVLIISLLIVLLLIGNHVRMFKYAVKATKLEEVDKMKDDFISMASHELRSPLTAIRGYVDLLRDEFSGQKGDASRYINNVGLSVGRLNSLVTDLLEVSRIEQNRLPVSIKTIDIEAIINSVVEEISVSAKEKGLDLQCDPIVPGMVMADPDRLKQILVNLLSNAIKYTEKGSVNIKTKADNKYYYITVADTGIGMSAEAVQKLFSKFYRISSEKTKGVIGTGLGLWISREIARKMEGDIAVESIEGVGSHFTLKLKIDNSSQK